MLPASIRLTRREDFAKAVRRGRRAARRTLVIHLAHAGSDHPDEAHPKVGFVVSRTVGGAVVRHRVQRRLRHLMRTRLSALPAGALVVVRALPAAADRDSAELGEDLDGALRRLGYSPADITADITAAEAAGSRPAAGSSRPSRDGRR